MPQHGRRRRRLGLIAKIAITLAALALALPDARARDVVDRLATTDPGWILAAIGIVFAQTVISALRWRRAARATGIVLRGRTALRALLVANGLGQALPASIGTDAARIGLVRRPDRPVAALVSGVVLDRLAGLMGLAIAAAAALALLPALGIAAATSQRAPGLALLPVAAALIGLAPVLAAGLLARRQRRRRKRRRVRPLDSASRRARLGAGADRVLRDLRRLARRPRLALALLAPTLVIHSLTGLAFWAVAQALGLGLEPAAGIALGVLLATAATLPIAIAGWGVREGAAVTLLPLAGIATADAFAASVAFGLMLLLAGAAGLGAWLLPSGDSRR
ncbi:lysylphosphatidylglycerol synthase transmembrane domain-containing protein [Tistrella bauzanensis]|uniref:Lysylphosphatidylglycerol synthase transmembrane domain-containing protein n=1 Tax=Tistrella arctica TaxID=3133430 RepID=A0ABU9YK05_9PROT